jgi:signal transduction histidine kinase
MVSIAASLQLGVSPVRVWWLGTRENGPSEVAQLAFGFLGALVYRESPWTIVALFIPVAMIYIAFSRLARANTQLEETVTNLETLRGQIVRTSKLASVGAISLDLAHQIKNPLAILLGELEELQERLEDGSPSRYHADVAADAGWRIQEMTQTFSTIGQQKWVELDMCELFDEACGMAGVRNSKRVEIRRHYQQRALKVNGNSVLIREALSNIFSNAIEAVEEGQVININLSRVNGSVVGRVDDNGAGIPADVMAHLFEPFYSGKPNGQGLGLFAARHIVEMHDGSIEIKSDEGEGTTVTISLPVAADLEESLA